MAERMVTRETSTYNVTLTNAITGETLMAYTTERKPKETKVIADYVRTAKTVVPVAITVEGGSRKWGVPVDKFMEIAVEIFPEAEELEPDESAIDVSPMLEMEPEPGPTTPPKKKKNA